MSRRVRDKHAARNPGPVSAECASHRTFDDVTAEFVVMRVVGNALGQLADAESQMRVLRWAAERLQAGPAAGPTFASIAEFAAPSTNAVNDPGLTLDGFDPFAEQSVAAVGSEIAEREGPESLIHGSVADFQGGGARLAGA